MKKIAVFVYDATLYGGAERVAANLANELCRDYEVHLISCFASREELSFPLGEQVQYHVLNRETLSIPVHCHGLAKKLRSILRDNGVQVMLNITAGVNTVAWLGTRGTKVKVIYCEHSNLVNKTYGKKHQLRQWLGAKTADKVIALTQTDQQEFQRKYHIGSKADFIYNWYAGPIDTAHAPDSRRIIAVGRLEYIKGYDRMIQAAARVFAKHPDWALDIYGEGTYRDAIARQIGELHLEDHVFLKGNCPDMMDRYRDYAFCVMSSYYEGFGLALVEAMAHGLPAVSFDCLTGPREIIRDGVNGLLVENGDIGALARGMERLIEDPELLRAYALHTTDDLHKFDKEVIYQRWVQTIDGLIDEP